MLRWLKGRGGPFKNIEFVPGFNVLLADRSPESSDRATRNATGKTTAINLVHFMLGADLRPTDPLRVTSLEAYEFELGIDLFGSTVTVRRSFASPSRVRIVGQVPQPLREMADDTSEISLEQYKTFLAAGLYGLTQSETSEFRLAPSVRALLSYAIRRDRVAFGDPFRIFAQQPELHRQVCVAFLMGLDWKPIARLSGLREREKQLKSLQDIIEQGIVPGIEAAPGAASDESMFELERQISETQDRLSNFRIIDDSEGVLSRADELTASISALRDAQYVDQRYLTLFEASLAETDNEPVAVPDIEMLYEEAAALFPEHIRASLDEARAFHERLFSNRRSYLAAEIASYRQRIQSRGAEIRELGIERDGLLQLVAAGGALEEYTALQGDLEKSRSRLQTLTESRERAKEVRKMTADVRLEAAQVQQVLEYAIADASSVLETLAREFNRISGRLYDRGGSLHVDASDRGYRFDTRLDGGSSTGVSNMRTVCFDLAVWGCRAVLGRRPDFLVHDSNLFDGVDERQQRGALESAHTLAVATAGQYICALNSDDVPLEVKEKPWFVDGTVLRLSDESELGSLFEVRF